MKAENSLLRGAYQNGWLCLRPNLETAKFEKATEQDWAQNLKLGSHRLNQQWFENRFNLDEAGMPKMPIISKQEDEEQSYTVEPNEQRTLKSWQDLAQTGKLTEDDLKSLQEEPWFEMEVNGTHGISTFSPHRNWKG